MNKTAVINVVGLSKKLLGANTPFLSKWSANKNISTIDPVLPAVTCSVQTTYLTGKWPSEHGIVGNGWFFRDEQEIKLWRQSNKLVLSPSIWDNARKRDPNFTCANMFWWYNMYSGVDYSVTPRPQYRANGLKIPDCYCYPVELRDQLQAALGTFPLFYFWGPKTSIKSSQWIADAAKWTQKSHNPDLLLVYLPHLDYVLQKYGHDQKCLPKDLQGIDAICADLITYLENLGLSVNVISEYGITDVEQPIHINRVLRNMGLINVRIENGLELLDAGASKAFALADHQIAHIYIQDLSLKDEVKAQLEKTPGIEMVLDAEEKKSFHIDHDRAGELVAIADKRSWFTYYYWEDDTLAPDFARTVEIHKKPGYDPVEMFLDPKKKLIIPRIVVKLLAKKLGFRTMMDLIPLDASLVKGSHGRVSLEEKDKAVFIGNHQQSETISAIHVHDAILDQIFKI